MAATTHAFQPDYAVPPGDTLRELLEERGMSQAELAIRTDMAEKTISQIISGDAPISLETARRLELVLGASASFWNNRELAFREALARRNASSHLAADVEWLKEIPWKELVARRYVEDSTDKSVRVRQALKFFRVSSVSAWREAHVKPTVHFRGGSVVKKHPVAVATWLRMGEIEADRVDCEPYDEKKFRLAIGEIRRVIDQPVKVWHQAMIEQCRSAGVAVVFVKEIPGASVSGATRWACKDEAILQLSLKFKKVDQVLFSFFHEAAHILKHGKKQVFVEDGESAENAREELEADEFARHILMPPRFDPELAALLPHCSKADVVGLAKRIGVPPGVVVGRLHRMGMSHRLFQGLRTVLQWE